MTMMNASFKLGYDNIGGGTLTLRIGTDLMLPNECQPRGYVALLLERQPCNGPNDSVPPVEVTKLAALPPSHARAIASAILCSAKEAADESAR
jgi:hypothetical protein